MTLQGIRPGDIIEVDKKGRRFFAIVTKKEAREVSIRPLDTRITYHSASAREVVAHWKRMGVKKEAVGAKVL